MSCKANTKNQIHGVKHAAKSRSRLVCALCPDKQLDLAAFLIPKDMIESCRG
jgi:hypothetical protein